MKIELIGNIVGTAYGFDRYLYQPHISVDAKVCGDLDSGIDFHTISGIPVTKSFHSAPLGTKIKITIETIE